jgi:hypothetical protein
MTAPSPRSPWPPSRCGSSATRRPCCGAGWEVVAPTRLALVTFCYADGSRTPDELETVNRRVADAMLVDELAAAV